MTHRGTVLFASFILIYLFRTTGCSVNNGLRMDYLRHINLPETCVIPRPPDRFWHTVCQFEDEMDSTLRRIYWYPITFQQYHRLTVKVRGAHLT